MNNAGYNFQKQKEKQLPLFSKIKYMSWVVFKIIKKTIKINDKTNL